MTWFCVKCAFALGLGWLFADWLHNVWTGQLVTGANDPIAVVVWAGVSLALGYLFGCFE